MAADFAQFMRDARSLAVTLATHADKHDGSPADTMTLLCTVAALIIVAYQTALKDDQARDELLLRFHESVDQVVAQLEMPRR